MSTLTKPRAKKPARAVRKAPAAKRPLDTDPRFPGLVRSPVTGLLITPMRPGEKPMDPAVLKDAKTAAPFPGLVRDPLTGLHVKPLAPGQKPISRKVLAAALVEAL